MRSNIVVERIFLGLRPAVVALVAAPVFNMAKSAHITWSNCWIPVVCALLIFFLGVSPVLVIFLAALLGYLYSRIIIKQ
jgi:chromate transporter